MPSAHANIPPSRSDAELIESATGDRVNLDETMFHLEHNPMLEVPGMRRRLFDMMVVDAIIDNPDRNNGNWGVLSTPRGDSLAPVYDNGNAFASKVDDEHLDTDPQTITRKWIGSRTIYEREGHQLSNKALFALPYPDIAAAAADILAEYQRRRGKIADLVNEVPDAACSPKRKRAYLAGMDARAEWIAEDLGLK